MQIERVAEADDTLMEKWLEETPIEAAVLHAAIRRATIANRFIPVCMGAAFKNKGVQLLLDAVTYYLPDPTQVPNGAVQLDANRAEVAGAPPIDLVCDPDKPTVAYAFKLEEGRFGS